MHVVHEGHVLAQLNRALAKIEALLRDAMTTLDSVAHFIVYLRDPDDAHRVQQILDHRFPTTPILLSWAPVGRPTWLIEVEAVAIHEYDDDRLPNY